MQIHIFAKVIEEIESGQRFVSPIKYYNNYCILVVYIYIYLYTYFIYFVHSMFSRILGRRMVNSYEYNCLCFVNFL